jgi:hypothetical protein
VRLESFTGAAQHGNHNFQILLDFFGGSICAGAMSQTEWVDRRQRKRRALGGEHG